MTVPGGESGNGGTSEPSSHSQVDTSAFGTRNDPNAIQSKRIHRRLMQSTREREREGERRETEETVSCVGAASEAAAGLAASSFTAAAGLAAAGLAVVMEVKVMVVVAVVVVVVVLVVVVVVVVLEMGDG